MTVKKKKQLSPVEPDVLNTPLLFLALSHEFVTVAGNAGFYTFQDMVDQRERIQNSSVFSPQLETELFEYAEYHNFLDLLGIE